MRQVSKDKLLLPMVLVLQRCSVAMLPCCCWHVAVVIGVVAGRITRSSRPVQVQISATRPAWHTHKYLWPTFAPVALQWFCFRFSAFRFSKPYSYAQKLLHIWCGHKFPIVLVPPAYEDIQLNTKTHILFTILANKTNTTHWDFRWCCCCVLILSLCVSLCRHDFWQHINTHNLLIR